MQYEHTDYTCHMCSKRLKAYKVCSCLFFNTPENYKSDRVKINKDKQVQRG